MERVKFEFGSEIVKVMKRSVKLQNMIRNRNNTKQNLKGSTTLSSRRKLKFSVQFAGRTEGIFKNCLDIGQNSIFL